MRMHPSTHRLYAVQEQARPEAEEQAAKAQAKAPASGPQEKQEQAPVTERPMLAANPLFLMVGGEAEGGENMEAAVEYAGGILGGPTSFPVEFRDDTITSELNLAETGSGDQEP